MSHLRAWALSMLAVSVFVTAQEAQAVTTIGVRNCDQWSKYEKREQEVNPGISILESLPTQSWLMGFLTGLNTAYPSDKDFLGAVDGETIYLWMDRYCAANPKSNLFEGGQQLFRELRKITR